MVTLRPEAAALARLLPSEDRMSELQDRLRRLSINDARSIGTVLATDHPGSGRDDLEPLAAALVRLGVLIALDGPAPAFEWATADAMANGATEQDVVGVLLAAAPLVGSAHVVSTAPRLARALGYDIDADLERYDGPPEGSPSLT
jgi:alkylhydroperoxidase/carboxymuconolactone decarboxylase family protein YurZ